MLEYDYAITLYDIPNYGRVKVLFGLKNKIYNNEENGAFVIDVKEVETRIQYKSLKKILEKKGYI